jgi:hypothetical protein
MTSPAWVEVPPWEPQIQQVLGSITFRLAPSGPVTTVMKNEAAQPGSALDEAPESRPATK